MISAKKTDGKMRAKHTISINGQRYDAVTGLRLENSADTAEQGAVHVTTRAAVLDIHRIPAHPSTHSHQQLHKSATLRRSHLATPESKVKPSAPVRHTAGHVSTSPMISHFASHPQPLPRNRPAKMINDIGPTVRHAPVAPPAARPQLHSKEVKERLIAHAGTEVDRSLSTAAKHAKPKRTPLLKRIRKHHVVAAGLASLLLIGYVTYLNVPGLSVRIAAAQAGVNAKYPDYNPDGYRFQGPVAFEQGEVDLHFASNGGGEGYTIVQKNSDWNSVAVLDNLVSKESEGEYEVNSTGGIIVYTYGTQAAWTNGGVLYTIDGEAPLSSDQLVRIASSM